MLRRSPRRTPRLLAANRSNACKSTGPRTADGKAISSRNALRNGRWAKVTGLAWPVSFREDVEFLRLVEMLRWAMMPANSPKGRAALEHTALRAWAVRRHYKRWAAACPLKDRLLIMGRKTQRPMGYRLVQPLPDWAVSILVWVRCSRGASWERIKRTTDPEEMKKLVPTLQVGVTVSCPDHPWNGPDREGYPAPPEDAHRALRFKTRRVDLRESDDWARSHNVLVYGANSGMKPECARNETSSQNVSSAEACVGVETTSDTAVIGREGAENGVGLGTKPECSTNQTSCENVSSPPTGIWIRERTPRRARRLKSGSGRRYGTRRPRRRTLRGGNGSVPNWLATAVRWLAKLTTRVG